MLDFNFPHVFLSEMQKGQSVSAVEHCKTQVKLRTLKLDVGAHDPSISISLTFSQAKCKKSQSAPAVEHCKTLVKVRSLLDFLARLPPIDPCKFAAGTPPVPIN